MTTLMADRFKRYNKDDVSNISETEKLTADDLTYLTAVSTFAVVADVPGQKEGKLGHLRSVDIPVFQVSSVPTGIYKPEIGQAIILINEEQSILDYDLISELHPVHDWDIYLWLSVPWSDVDEDLGIYGEWYRSDVYPDGMVPFDGKVMGWEDLAP